MGGERSVLDSVLVLSSLIDMVSATGSEVREPARPRYHVCLRSRRATGRSGRDGRERTDAFAVVQLERHASATNGGERSLK